MNKKKIRYKKLSPWLYKEDIDKLDSLVEKEILVSRSEFFRLCIHNCIKNNFSLQMNGYADKRKETMSVKVPVQLYFKFEQVVSNIGLPMSTLLRKLIHEELKVYFIRNDKLWFVDYETAINSIAISRLKG